jgi:hypothetical protein
MNGWLLHYSLMRVNCFITILVTCIRGKNTSSCALLYIPVHPVLICQYKLLDIRLKICKLQKMPTHLQKAYNESGKFLKCSWISFSVERIIQPAKSKHVIDITKDWTSFPLFDIYGGIFLLPTCKIDYVNMQENYVNMQKNYVSMQVTNL